MSKGKAVGLGAGYITSLSPGSLSERVLRNYFVLVFTLQKRKLRPRELKSFAQGSHSHTAEELKLQFMSLKL